MTKVGYSFSKGNQINKGRIPWNKIPLESLATKPCASCGLLFKKDTNQGNVAWEKRQFCSKSCKTKGNKYRLGTKQSIETRKKMSASHPKGELSPYWIKDRTQLKRFGDVAKDRRSYAYNYWRKCVFTRDSYKCRMLSTECEGKITAHHIYSFTFYPELRYSLTNGITLCLAHHPRVRAEEKRLARHFTLLATVLKV